MRVLIAEDEPITQKRLESLLSEFGACAVVDNGIAALEQYKEACKSGEYFDLIALDINMPGMDGQSVLEYIREAEMVEKSDQGVHTKIIMITSHEDMSSVEKAFAHGCEAYINKPVNKNSLLRQLSALGLI